MDPCEQGKQIKWALQLTQLSSWTHPGIERGNPNRGTAESLQVQVGWGICKLGIRVPDWRKLCRKIAPEIYIRLPLNRYWIQGCHMESETPRGQAKTDGLGSKLNKTKSSHRVGRLLSSVPLELESSMAWWDKLFPEWRSLWSRPKKLKNESQADRSN